MNILITGMSGTGKSTVINVLRERGYTAIDTDDDDWLVPTAGHDSEWLWDEVKIARLLDDPGESDVFISGTRENQGRFYPRFDHIVLLTAPIDVMLHRVTSRDTNAYGSLPWERKKIAQDKAEFEPVLRAGATVVWDTSVYTAEEIASRLIALTQRTNNQQ